MGIAELLGVAASFSLLAGWRMYACIFAAGLAMRLGILDLPERLQMLDALANPWVLGLAGLGMVVELLADKVMWLDSLWDSVHTFIRPLGGALLALAIVDPGDPVWQVLVFLLGGGAALASHGAKAGARAVVNASPEPVSNVVVSSAEDVATFGGLAFVLTQPALALGVAAVILVLVVAGLWLGWRALRRLKQWGRGGVSF